MGIYSTDIWSCVSCQNLSMPLCLFKVGEEAGWAGLGYSHLVLSCWGAVSSTLMLWYEKRPWGSRSQSCGCQTHTTLRMINEENVTMWLGTSSSLMSWDCHPAKGSCRPLFWIGCKCESQSVRHSLSVIDIFTVDNTRWTGSPFKYVAHCLKTTFGERTECGIVFQTHICLGVFF